MKNTENNNANRLSETSLAWARITFASTVAFLILLGLLHIIKPELDPSWRMISEYAIGKFGWLMVVAFFLLALSFAGMFFAIRSQVQTRGGKIGLFLLLASSFSLVLAGIFTTDPVTISQEAQTTSGALHNLGGTLGIAMPAAIILVSWSLYKNPNWLVKNKSILWSAGFSLLGFVVSIASLGFFLSQSNGVMSASTPVGYTLRFELLTYCLWLLVIAYGAVKLRSKETK